ncbi:TlpA family protein disulfide reductase [Candidatus Pelagibacter bacterium nBUS_29]|uniref:TlpA family protein disulfide reductase n=1 Tax=Candidatus Pelagibacter bacterium nBUS_29 TaxID=3374190 RepID=UPI003EB9F775
MRFLILFIFLITNVAANELSEIKNIVIHKDLKTYDNLIFLDKKDQKINIKDFNGSLVLMNFWATWCEPCKEEMPSLDRLQNDPKLNNLKIFVINIEKENLKKVNKFLQELNIKNLEPYFDNPITLAKKLSLRGVPTTVLFNTEGKEFARIMGSIDFDDLKFIEWLKNYN